MSLLHFNFTNLSVREVYVWLCFSRLYVALTTVIVPIVPYGTIYYSVLLPHNNNNNNNNIVLKTTLQQMNINIL